MKWLTIYNKCIHFPTNWKHVYITMTHFCHTTTTIYRSRGLYHHPWKNTRTSPHTVHLHYYHLTLCANTCDFPQRARIEMKRALLFVWMGSRILQINQHQHELNSVFCEIISMIPYHSHSPFASIWIWTHTDSELRWWLRRNSFILLNSFRVRLKCG